MKSSLRSKELLEREKRVSYRGLKRRFALDNEYLEDLKEELIGAKRLAADEDGCFLVWRGEQEAAVTSPRPPSRQPSTPPVEPVLPKPSAGSSPSCSVTC